MITILLNRLTHFTVCIAYVALLCHLGNSVLLTVATRNWILPSSCIPLPNLIFRYCGRWTASVTTQQNISAHIPRQSAPPLFAPFIYPQLCSTGVFGQIPTPTSHSNKSPQISAPFPPLSPNTTRTLIRYFGWISIFINHFDLIAAGDSQAKENWQEEECCQQGVDALPEAHVEELDAVIINLRGNAQNLDG